MSTEYTYSYSGQKGKPSVKHTYSHTSAPKKVKPLSKWGKRRQKLVLFARKSGKFARKTGSKALKVGRKGVSAGRKGVSVGKKIYKSVKKAQPKRRSSGRRRRPSVRYVKKCHYVKIRR